MLTASWLLLTGVARADSPACSPADTSLNCRLSGVLTWLEGAAIILTLILLAVIGVAIHLIRKNQISRRDRR